jgi:lysophospholipase L1-like esterase
MSACAMFRLSADPEPNQGRDDVGTGVVVSLSPSARLRAVRKPAMCVLLALLLLEAALQVRAYALLRAEPAPPAQARPRVPGVVLCMGDSVTLGVGASSPFQTYPAHLQRILDRARPGAFHVVSSASAGRSSSELRDLLRAEIALHAPEHVCVMIGTNDRWSAFKRPQPVPGFPWRCRTLELLREGVSPRAGSGSHPAPAAADRLAAELIGCWQSEVGDLVFEPGGRMFAGDTELRWRTDAFELHVTMLGGAEIALRCSLDAGGSLVLQGGPWPTPHRFVRGGEGLRALRIAQQSLREGHAALAIDSFRACARWPELAVAARAGLVEALAACGKIAEAKQELLALEREFTEPLEHAPADSLEQLARARICAGRTHEGIALAADLVTREPDRDRAWRLLVEYGLAQEYLPMLERAACAMLGRADTPDPTRVRALHTLVYVEHKRDPEKALGHALEAALITHDEDLLVATLAGQAGGDGGRFARCVAASSADPQQRARLLAMYAWATAPDRDWAAELERALGEIERLCAEHHAELLLLEYPWPVPEADRALERLCGQGARVVPLQAAFGRELATRPRGDLFILDDHCKDAGYELLARNVAAALLSGRAASSRPR